MRDFPHIEGDWRPIDHIARRRRRTLVRSGDNYATAYWTAGENGQWAFVRTTHPLPFKPKEYRV